MGSRMVRVSRWARAGSAGGFFLSVVDVPVIISDKLQQSIVLENVEVPQIQFIDRGVDLSVVLQRRVPTVQTVQKTGEIPQMMFSDKVETPVVVQRQVFGVDSAENFGISAVAVLTRWSMSLFMQFIDGYGRRCDHAATSGLVLEVPQTQFIARVGRHCSAHRDGHVFLRLELSASFRSPRW